MLKPEMESHPWSQKSCSRRGCGWKNGFGFSPTMSHLIYLVLFSRPVLDHPLAHLVGKGRIHEAHYLRGDPLNGFKQCFLRNRFRDSEHTSASLPKTIPLFLETSKWASFQGSKSPLFFCSPCRFARVGLFCVVEKKKKNGWPNTDVIPAPLLCNPKSHVRCGNNQAPGNLGLHLRHILRRLQAVAYASDRKREKKLQAVTLWMDEIHFAPL